MPHHRRYRVPNDESLAALMQERSIGGFPIEPLPPIEVRDCYLDGETTPLLRARRVLRLRISEGLCTALLQPVGRRPGPIVSQQIPAPESPSGIVFPDGPLRDAVEAYTGGITLIPILDLHQYRTPRSLNLNGQPVGIVALDMVSDETVARIGVWSAVEVELVESMSSEMMDSVHETLKTFGLMEDTLTKFERGVLRRSANPEAPLILLPEERELLEELLSSPVSVERRRAQTILLSAENLTAREISRRVGLAPSRVRHWQEAFRTERFRVFDGPDVDLQTMDGGKPFRITPLVETPDEFEADYISASTSKFREEPTALEENLDDFWIPIEEEPLYESSEPAAETLIEFEAVKENAEVGVPLFSNAEFTPHTPIDAVVRNVIRRAIESCRLVTDHASPEAVQTALQTTRLVPLALEWMEGGSAESSIHDAIRYLERLHDQDVSSTLLQKETEHRSDVPLSIALAKIILGVERRKAIESRVLEALIRELSTLQDTLPETDKQLRHVLGSSLWKSIEQVSMYRSDSGVEALHKAVGLLEDHLQFLPSVPNELAAVVFSRISIEEFRSVELLIQHLDDIAEEWIEADGSVDRTPLDQLIERFATRRDTLSERVNSRWESLESLTFRSIVAQSIAAL